MHRHFLRLGLCDEQGDTPAPVSGGETKPLTIGQQIKAAIAAKADLQTKITAHEATIAERDATITAKDGEVTALKAEIETLKSQIATLQADAKEVADALETHKTEAANLRAQEQDIAKRAAAQAKEKLAALGFPAAQLPAASENVSDVPRKITNEQFEKLSHDERNAFFREGGKLIGNN